MSERDTRMTFDQMIKHQNDISARLATMICADYDTDVKKQVLFAIEAQLSSTRSLEHVQRMIEARESRKRLGYRG